MVLHDDGSVGFFDEFPLPPPAPTPDHHAHSVPPRGVGGFVPWRVVLYRSKNAIVALRHFEAFPSGLLFELVTVSPPGAYDPLQPSSPPTSEVVVQWRRTAPRLGVRFADGRGAASGSGAPTTQQTPERPQLQGLGGFGKTTFFWRAFWLWQLPPPGRLIWFATWPGMGIDEVSGAVDASILTVAAAEAMYVSDRGLPT